MNSVHFSVSYPFREQSWIRMSAEQLIQADKYYHDDKKFGSSHLFDCFHREDR